MPIGMERRREGRGVQVVRRRPTSGGGRRGSRRTRHRPIASAVLTTAAVAAPSALASVRSRRPRVIARHHRRDGGTVKAFEELLAHDGLAIGGGTTGTSARAGRTPTVMIPCHGEEFIVGIGRGRRRGGEGIVIGVRHCSFWLAVRTGGGRKLQSARLSMAKIRAKCLPSPAVTDT